MVPPARGRWLHRTPICRKADSGQMNDLRTMHQLGLLARASPIQAQIKFCSWCVFCHSEWCGGSRTHVTKECFRRRL